MNKHHLVCSITIMPEIKSKQKIVPTIPYDFSIITVKFISEQLQTPLTAGFGYHCLLLLLFPNSMQ